MEARKRSKFFYMAFALLTLLFTMVIFGHLHWIFQFSLIVLLFSVLFLFAYQEFIKDHAILVKYLCLAIGAMFIGFFFLQRNYPGYNHPLGTIFFLVANLSYTRLFYKSSDHRIKPVIPFILIAFVVTGTIIILLFDYYGTYYGLGLVYLFVLFNCLQAAWLRRNMVDTISFRLVFYGMLLFFSAQVLAFFNHVQLNLHWLTALEVAMYILSQLMIIRGLKLEKDNLEVMDHTDHAGG